MTALCFGEEDLSGEFQVDDTGAVSIPLVGEVSAGGQTLRSFEAAVRARLSEGYLKDPRVSVQVLNYRPFYIIGEVEKGGEYPFVSGMHVLNAVAVAGGAPTGPIRPRCSSRAAARNSSSRSRPSFASSRAT